MITLIFKAVKCQFRSSQSKIKLSINAQMSGVLCVKAEKYILKKHDPEVQEVNSLKSSNRYDRKMS